MGQPEKLAAGSSLCEACEGRYSSQRMHPSSQRGIARPGEDFATPRASRSCLAGASRRERAPKGPRGGTAHARADRAFPSALSIRIQRRSPPSDERGPFGCQRWIKPASSLRARARERVRSEPVVVDRSSRLGEVASGRNAIRSLTRRERAGHRITTGAMGLDPATFSLESRRRTIAES